MPDAFLEWGMDLVLSASGDLALAAGTTLDQQRILRRLLTNPGGYSSHPGYGAGLGSYVGAPATDRAIGAAIWSQLQLEASVASIPPATISVNSQPGATVLVDIKYIDNITGTAQFLTFSIDG